MNLYDIRSLKPGYCIKSVPDGGRWVGLHQCTRKAVKDGYCKIHHPDAVEERSRAAAARRVETSPWCKLQRAFDKIHELQKEIGQLRRQLDRQHLTESENSNKI